MNVLAATLLLVILAGYYYEVATLECNRLSNTSCSTCVEKGEDHCYWCPDTGGCAKWDWGDLPSCKGSKYYYGQCNLNGAGFIGIVSVGVFLILVLIVVFFVCCCCCCLGCCRCRRSRRSNYERIRHVTEDPRDRQRYCHARRDEIRFQYGDTNM